MLEILDPNSLFPQHMDQAVWVNGSSVQVMVLVSNATRGRGPWSGWEQWPGLGVGQDQGSVCGKIRAEAMARRWLGFWWGHEVVHGSRAVQAGEEETGGLGSLSSAFCWPSHISQSCSPLTQDFRPSDHYARTGASGAGVPYITPEFIPDKEWLYLYLWDECLTFSLLGTESWLWIQTLPCRSPRLVRLRAVGEHGVHALELDSLDSILAKLISCVALGK